MKRRLVIGGLSILTCWPLAHRALVATFELNPWKFCGWAMFCVPNPRTVAVLYGFRGDQLVPFPPGQLRPEDEQTVRDYAGRRQLLGRLAGQSDIETLAQKPLAENPQLDRVGMVVPQLTLDSRTARIATRQDVYVYQC